MPRSAIASTRRRSPSSTPPSRTTNWSPRRPVPSGAATPSCSASRRRRRRRSCPTTPSRSSTAEYEWLFDEGRLIGGKPVPARRLGVRRPRAGPRPDEPEGDRREGRSSTWREGRRRRRSEAQRPQGEPDGHRTDARPEDASTGPCDRCQAGRRSRSAATGSSAGLGSGRCGSRAVVRSAGRRARQRADAVPRLRRAPSGRHQRQRDRREVLVARRRTSRSGRAASTATSRCG